MDKNERKSANKLLTYIELYTRIAEGRFTQKSRTLRQKIRKNPEKSMKCSKSVEIHQNPKILKKSTEILQKSTEILQNP